MRRFLFDSSGVLRPVVLAGLFVVVPVAVLALASWGGWAGLTVIAVIFAVGLVLIVRSDR
ncbi:hypothetical protein DFR72_101136 [Lentzea flaviverrucosa]|uniref:Uncharacterized protein n=2 Tax=Lentzea flaviverrucosa TaxID=200379 RepID=A0A1H9XW98_9PSEU|nr:hypothetical protein DFR72_101136 [Lentzea flaviverrucosa]SES50440.1 hypothetical protein SAMN05216195_12071 [Lentzea flaviverrucosa]